MQGCITLVGAMKEAVVRRLSTRLVPDSLNGVQLRRVGRQSVQLDTMGVGLEPNVPLSANAMKRSVFDDQKDLPPVAPNEELEEVQKGAAVEDVREAVGEFRIVQRQRTVHMCCLAFAACGHAWLHAYSVPRPVQRGVELEARLIFEEHDTAASLGFFLIVGNVCRIHRSWASWSARESNFRGR